MNHIVFSRYTTLKEKDVVLWPEDTSLKENLLLNMLVSLLKWMRLETGKSSMPKTKILVVTCITSSTAISNIGEFFGIAM